MQLRDTVRNDVELAVNISTLENLDKLLVDSMDLESHEEIINEITCYGYKKEVADAYNAMKTAALKLCAITSHTIDELKRFYADYPEEFVSVIEKVVENQENYKQQVLLIILHMKWWCRIIFNFFFIFS